jgi:hypothetical protein
MKIYGRDEFIWTGTGQLVKDHTNWDSGQPNGDGDCIFINGATNYTWWDATCEGISGFICEQ